MIQFVNGTYQLDGESIESKRIARIDTKTVSSTVSSTPRGVVEV